MRALLIHNPQAGAGDHKERELMAALKLGRLTPEYCSTKSEDFRAALARTTDCYVAAGGDGTIAKVVENLPDRSRPVALMPLGTANNVARAFGIAGSPQELAERYRPTMLGRLDIGMARGPWGEHRFIEAVGVGAVALAMGHKSSPESAPGSEKIMRGRDELARTLRDLEAVELEIDIDGAPYNGSYLAVEIMNTPSSGPALPLAPNADPGDGWLDVVLVREGDRAAFLDWLSAPQHSPPAFGQVVRGRVITLAWSAPVPLRIDDGLPELGTEPGRARIEIEPVPVLIMGLSTSQNDERGDNDPK